mmetsp:Transcript_29217/g.68820  ORF Transcript_29217/g.68820 Transcript_29217/m.68820 type:complete len:265 (-) Transcript_29217:3-797(-)
MNALLFLVVACVASSPVTGFNHVAVATAILHTPETPHFVAAAEVLAKSIRNFEKEIPVVAFVEEPVEHRFISRLKAVGFEVVVVDVSWVPKGAEIAGMKASIFGHNAWNKVLVIDADAMVVSELRGLFDQDIEDIAAAPEVHAPTRFNPGVMLVRTSLRLGLHARRVIRDGSFGVEQGDIFNGMFPGWFQSSPSHRLPLAYNVPSCLGELNGLGGEFYRTSAKIIHFYNFASPQNPWEGISTKRGTADVLAVLYWAIWFRGMLS